MWFQFRSSPLLSRASIKQPECKSPCSYSAGALGGLSPPLQRSRVQQWRFHKSSAQVKFAPLQVAAEGLLGARCDQAVCFPHQNVGHHTVCVQDRLSRLSISDYQHSGTEASGAFPFFQGCKTPHLLYFPVEDCRGLLGQEEAGRQLWQGCSYSSTCSERVSAR